MKLVAIVTKKPALVAHHGDVCSTLQYGIFDWGNSAHMRRAFVRKKYVNCNMWC